MALSATDKAGCRAYLGYPDQFRYKDTRLESVLSNLSPEAETQVQTNLANVAAVDAKLLAMALKVAGVKKADEVEFFGPTALRTELLRLGRTYCNRLSVILGVPINSDYFGRYGYGGDGFMDGRGGGSIIPLG